MLARISVLSGVIMFPQIVLAYPAPFHTPEAIAAREVMDTAIDTGDCNAIVPAFIRFARLVGPGAASVFVPFMHYGPAMPVLDDEGSSGDVQHKMTSAVLVIIYSNIYRGTLFRPEDEQFFFLYEDVLQSGSVLKGDNKQQFDNVLSALAERVSSKRDASFQNYKQCLASSRDYTETRQCLNTYTANSPVPDWEDWLDRFSRAKFVDGCKWAEGHEGIE